MSFKIFLVVISKEGLIGGTLPLLGMTTTKILKDMFLRHMPQILFSQKAVNKNYNFCICLVAGTGPISQISQEISNIPCKVCSAPSSGYHFGAITCEGCKVRGIGLVNSFASKRFYNMTNH